MSSEPPSEATATAPGDDSIRRAKAEIQTLVEEVFQLSRSDIDPTEFFAAILEKSVSALAAVGGVVWTIEEGGSFKLEYQINLQQTGLIGDDQAQAQHGKLLHQIVKRGEATLSPPHSGGEAGDDAAANPTPFLLVVSPIKTERGVDGLLEVFQRPGARPNTQRGYVHFLGQICEMAGEYLKTRRLRHFADKQTLWEQLESFTSLVHSQLASRDTAYTIANEGRRLIGCDRVTVVLRKGARYVVEAISGQDTFDKRSNAVRMLRELAGVVARSGEDLWYAGETADLSPQVEKAVNAYVDESHTKQLAVLPLREHDPHADDKTRDKKRENMLGAIVIEQLVDGRPPEGLMQRVDVVRRHGSTALTNAQLHEGLFLLPLWRFIGKSRVLVAARNLPWTILASIAAVALGLAAWLVPWDFTIPSNGKLQPQIRSNVFAAQDGTVFEVPVKDGDVVEKGQLLARQRSSQLDQQITELQGRIAENGEEQDTQARLQRQIMQSPPTRDTEMEKTKISSEIARLKEVSASLKKQESLLQVQQEQLQVTSPIAGKVVTWEVRTTLQGRPVKSGQRLMEIADPAQDWEAQIDVPESKMGHVVAYRNQLHERDPQAPLEVTFILATHPSIYFTGRVTKIHSSAEVAGDKGNTVRMDVAFDQAQLTKLTPSGAAPLTVAQIKRDLKVGADVRAKIHCGRAAVGYVILHDAWEFFQSRVLFRL